MATKVDRRGFVSQLKSLLSLHQRPKHTLAGAMRKKTNVGKGPKPRLIPGHDDISRWKKVDASTVGITKSMISPSSWLAIKTLRDEGFEAYLVGGCVRDLILKRIPKDFDVITNAELEEVRGAFRRALIVGRRFPICHVHLKGSVVEVSNFKKVGGHGKKEGGYHFPKSPSCCKVDYIRWRDCLRRDFTINSLFYDPFANKIYDYTDAMMDLKLLKLQTIISAHKSFKEDNARILRGLRIAARLGLSLSEDIEVAIFKLSSSVASLSEARLSMELNYMLSYGAAEPSLQLLRKYNLLEILLPFHGAYLNSQSTDSAPPSSLMFMKLFSFLDEVVACDQPCDSLLWISLLAFHLALVTHPQEALVVWTFSSVLYHCNWEIGVKAARQHALKDVNFKPEILDSSAHLSDHKLAEKVSVFASFVKESIEVLSDSESLLKAMAKAGFPSPQSKLALVSKKQGREVAQVIEFLVRDIMSDRFPRQSFKSDRLLLGKGNIPETRFVLGKVIIDTLSSGVGTDESRVSEKKRAVPPSDAETSPDRIKKLKLIEKEQKTTSKEREVIQKLASPSKKRPGKNNVHEEKAPRETPFKEQKSASPPSDTETTPERIKKPKLIEKEQKTTLKEREVIQKLASPSKKKPGKNNVHEKKAPRETPVKEQKSASPPSDTETTPERIKKQKLVEKGQKTISRERKVIQKVASSSKKSSENFAREKKAPQEMPVKEQDHVSEKKRAFPPSDAETTPERTKKPKLIENEQKTISMEQKVVQKLASSSKKKPRKNNIDVKKAPQGMPVKEQNRVSRLSDLFK